MDDPKPITDSKAGVAAEDVSIHKAATNFLVGGVELPELLRGLSPEELEALEKKLRRKVDMRLLPTLILICKPILPASMQRLKLSTASGKAFSNLHVREIRLRLT